MTAGLLLDSHERDLIHELLEREHAQLSVALRHSRTHTFKDALRERMTTLEHILTQFETPAPPGQPGESVRTVPHG